MAHIYKATAGPFVVNVSSSTVDLTTVLSALIMVLQPDGTTVLSWTAVVSERAVGACKLTYALLTTSLIEVGQCAYYAVLTTTTGVVRTDAYHFTVVDPFAIND